MILDDLLIKIKTLWETRGGGQIKSYVSKHKETIKQLKEFTDFLPETSHTIERAFCFINGISSTVKCIECNVVPIKWNKTKREYSQFCSTTCSANNKRTREKARRTNLKKYGVENPSQNKEIKKHKQQTCLKNYGVRYPYQSKTIRQQFKETCLKNYGVENPSQNDRIQLKKKQTNLIKYGTNNYSQQHNPSAFKLLSNYDWLYDQYINLGKTSTEIANQLNIASSTTVCNYLRHYDIPIKQIANFSRICISWLDYISNKENIFIQHAGNVGEYIIPKTGYLSDGYCEETNTIYEFHGDTWHGNPEIYSPNEHCHPFDPEITAGELYEKTLQREQQIKQLGYKLVVMWENDWKNITPYINNTKEIIFLGNNNVNV